MERHTSDDGWIGIHLAAMKMALDEIQFYQYPKNESDYRKRTIMQYKSLRSFTDLYYSFKNILKAILPEMGGKNGVIETFYKTNAKDLANTIKHPDTMEGGDLLFLSMHHVLVNPDKSNGEYPPYDEETMRNFYQENPTREHYMYGGEETPIICQNAYDELIEFYENEIKNVVTNKT